MQRIPQSSKIPSSFAILRLKGARDSPPKGSITHEDSLVTGQIKGRRHLLLCPPMAGCRVKNEQAYTRPTIQHKPHNQPQEKSVIIQSSIFLRISPVSYGAGHHASPFKGMMKNTGYCGCFFLLELESWTQQKRTPAGNCIHALGSENMRAPRPLESC